ncbi:AAA family ATPase [bacterium]|nr:AAA family ATPase [bacterium]
MKLNHPEDSKPEKQLGNLSLKERFDKDLKDGERVIVIAAEPGMGKTYFLRSLALSYDNSIFLDIRCPLSMDTSEGFWTALLYELGVKNSDIPKSAYKSSLLAKELLPLEGGKTRLLIIDSLGRAPKLMDNAGFAGLDDLPEGVVVVIGTRPGHHLAVLEASGAKIEWIIGDCEESKNCISRWVTNKYHDLPQELAEGIAENAGGNFLIAKHLVKAVVNGDLQPHELSSTCETLESALEVLWEEQYNLAPFEIRDDMVMVACLIAESGEPLTDAGIADFLGYSAGRVDRALSYLRPLFCNKGLGLTFFSRRLNEFVAKKYRRDLVKVHERVISFFRDAYPSWEEMDDSYGWFYLGHHCDRLARTSRKHDFSTLHWLGEGPYIKAKLGKTHSLTAVIGDLSRCLRAALEENDLPRIVSYGLRIPRLRAKECVNGLHDLADAGDFVSAYDRAKLLKMESCRLKALLLLSWQAAAEGQRETALKLFGEAVQVIDADIMMEDRLLYAFMLADILDIAPFEQVETIFLNCRNPEHSVEAAWRLSIMIKLPKNVRLEVLKTALKCAQKIDDKQAREKHIKRLQTDLNNLRRSKASEADSRQAFVNEINSITLGSFEELDKLLKDMEEAEDEAARSQAFRNALEYTGSYKDEAQRVDAIARLVKELIKYNNADWLIASFEDLITAIVALHSPLFRQRAVVYTCRIITGVPRLKGWRDIFVRLGAVIETIESPALRVGAWVWLTLARYEARDYKGAQDTLNQSAALAFHIQDLADQARALGLLSSCAAAVGNTARARNLAYHSLQAWESPSVNRVDAETKSAIVVGISANIDEERSLEYYDYSIKAALNIPDVRVRANLLAALASNLYKMGEEDWARRTQNQALEQARTMEPGASQALTLSQLAIQESLCGNVSSADQILIEAEETARREESPFIRREALLTVASAKRSGGDEIGASAIIAEVMGNVEALPYAELCKASDLCVLAELVKDHKTREALVRTLKRVHKGLRSLSHRDAQEALLLIVCCWLSLKEVAEAKELFAEITEVGVKSKAKIALAISSLETDYMASVKLLSSIPIFSERMRGVKECAEELLHSETSLRRGIVKKALTELTLLAVEDEKCADILISKWVSLSKDRKSIIDTLTKIGYQLKDVLSGNLGSISAALE